MAEQATVEPEIAYEVSVRLIPLKDSIPRVEIYSRKAQDGTPDSLLPISQVYDVLAEGLSRVHISCVQEAVKESRKARNTLVLSSGGNLPV